MFVSAAARDVLPDFTSGAIPEQIFEATDALLLASAPRREGTLGKVRLSPIAEALRAKGTLGRRARGDGHDGEAANSDASRQHRSWHHGIPNSTLVT